MSEANGAGKIIVGLFAVGLVLALAGHRYQTHQQSEQITWHDVNVELQNVEQARIDLFSTLNDKIIAQQ